MNGYKFTLHNPVSSKKETGYLHLTCEGDQAVINLFLTAREGIDLFELLEKELGEMIFAERAHIEERLDARRQRAQEDDFPQHWPDSAGITYADGTSSADQPY